MISSRPKRILTAALLGLALPALTLPALADAAAPVVFKLATLAPDGSTWMKALTAMNEELIEKTRGAVKFKFYPGGVSGDEKDVVMRVRIGQLQAAAFTGVGLGEIAPDVRILDAPWLFKSDAEVDFVYKTFAKQLSSAIDKGGYVLLGWIELGPVYVFTKNPLKRLEDLRQQKMWVWEGDPIAEAAYRALGVSPIPLSIVDVLSSLQTGLINGVYGPPLGIVALQWFERARYIYPVPMARSAGAVLLSKRAFARLSGEQQKTLLEVAGKHLRRLNERSRRENAEALAALQKRGLVMSPAAPSPQTLKKLDRLGRQARRSLAGKLYSASLLGSVEKALTKFRHGQAQKS
ncbi:MAG: TRAP transporter substrate-binding protein DctP [Elusimicrobia bacterium]|nr:TRAP transporter substrate-binding protein DctP [Elusimicrobiota bacterium]MDE2237793.1 TRAP transporter substrate-binding protein DctP [Elusimicrobiota bacterium]MDE2424495.1 TRAP transporter substrate-binding protein DctP [Elusimicrobiota bacterium]